jgi:CDP-glucose 4,6-dehydratase
LAGTPLAVRAPAAVRPWQHVLCPLEGYLTLAERLWAGEPGMARAWNFGPAPEDAQTAAWLVERVRERWPGALDVRQAPPGAATGEAPALRLDAGLAREQLGWTARWDLAAGLDATVSWYAGYRDGADMRAETLRQIAAFERGEA